MPFPTSATTPVPLGGASSRLVHVLLWTVQALLAAVFLFGGATKLVLPAAALVAQSPLPVAFLRGIGLLEVCGALGLVLPGLLRLPAALTALAAGGLVLLMCGAVGATMAGPTFATQPALVLIPIAVGALAAIVAVGRARGIGSASSSTGAGRARGVAREQVTTARLHPPARLSA